MKKNYSKRKLSFTPSNLNSTLVNAPLGYSQVMRILLVLAFFCLTSSHAQELAEQLSYLGTKVYQSRTTELRLQADQELQDFLDSLFSTANSYSADFGEQTFISDLSPSNNAFRLISWAIPLDNGEMKYSGRIIQEGDSLPIFYTLIDSSSNYYFEKEEIHGADKWFGALYYEIVELKHKKTVSYAVLGWDGYSSSSTRKIIEPLHFDKKKGPVFGAKQFEFKGKKQSRLILEYSKDAGVSLTFNGKMNMIVYDHLVPMDGAPIGMYAFYIPDFTYEGLQWKKGKWIHHSMVNPENLSEY